MDTARPSLSIDPAALRQRLGLPGAPLVLDVRRAARFDESPWLIAGAQRCAPEDIPALAASQARREAVVYCVYGHEVGTDAASALCAAGWDARFLADGIEGPDAPLRIRKRPDLGVTGEQPSRWITRARPKIDRIACPWLIRRFIDPRAQFTYVPHDQVFAQAEKLGAVPFDIEGAPISHAWERCSFDALLDAFELKDEALDALATIVRGADTARFAIAPEAAGLLAVSLGLSRQHADDQAMLAAAMPVYDALYTWCLEARKETHSWAVHHPMQGGPSA